MLAASLSVLLLSGTAAWGTARGLGPFVGADPHAGLLALWSYVTAQACTSVLICGLTADLLSSRRQHATLFQHANEGIVLVGPDGRIGALNPAAGALLGLAEAAVRGARVADLPWGNGQVLAHWLAMDTGSGPPHGDLPLTRGDGASLRVEAQAARHCDARGQWQTQVMLRDVSEARALEQQLRQLARVDHLTGLPNRLQFEDTLREAMARARRNRLMLALAYVDVDHFKAVNDQWGHAGGDTVLTEFGRRLRQSVRTTDAVARLGGDEFVVILEQLRSAEEAEVVARKITLAMQDPVDLPEGPAAATASIGMGLLPAGAPDDDETTRRLMATADAALYDAKRAGRNTFRSRVCAPQEPPPAPPLPDERQRHA